MLSANHAKSLTVAITAGQGAFAADTTPFAAIPLFIATYATGTATADAGTKDIIVNLTNGSFGTAANQNDWYLGGSSAADNSIVSVMVDAIRETATITLSKNIAARDQLTITAHSSVFVNASFVPFISPLPVIIDGKGTAYASLVSAVAGTEITLTATPNSGYRFGQWQVISGGVTITDNKFTMPEDNVTVKAIFEEVPQIVPEYNITDGADGSWKTDTSGGMKIICDGDYAKFIGLKVDGSLISADNYTAAEGSTVITLNREYLTTLHTGIHTVTRWCSA